MHHYLIRTDISEGGSVVKAGLVYSLVKGLLRSMLDERREASTNGMLVQFVSLTRCYNPYYFALIGLKIILIGRLNFQKG